MAILLLKIIIIYTYRFANVVYKYRAMLLHAKIDHIALPTKHYQATSVG